MGRDSPSSTWKHRDSSMWLRPQEFTVLTKHHRFSLPHTTLGEENWNKCLGGYLYQNHRQRRSRKRYRPKHRETSSRSVKLVQVPQCCRSNSSNQPHLATRPGAMSMENSSGLSPDQNIMSQPQPSSEPLLARLSAETNRSFGLTR